MESNSRRRRRRRRDDTKAPKPTVDFPTTEPPPAGGRATMTSTVHDIPDHVLELVFLCLVSSVCLVRAASACKRWCRVVADAGFLGRFRALRVPVVMGHYLNYSNPVFVPSSPTPCIPSRRSFSLDFVPEIGGAWEVVDSRGGLVLLKNKKPTAVDLVVCEPQTRRHHSISMPDQLRDRTCLGLFLLKGGAITTSISMSDFKVMAVLLRDHMLDPRRGVPTACVYRRSNRSWAWGDVNCAWKGNINVPRPESRFYFAGRANGSLYWAIKGAGAALVVDEATAAVSLEPLPVSVEDWHAARCFRVVGGADGSSLRAVCLVENELRVFARLKGVDEWVLENLVVRFPEDTPGALGVILDVHETYVLVSPRHSSWLFSVDLKTMAVERVRAYYLNRPAYPYELPWPPILNPNP